MNVEVRRVRNARLEIAVHRLREGDGTPLLLLHALHASARAWPHDLAWAGPVYALDFSGHGESDRAGGGGYTPELFVSDADAALAALRADVTTGAEARSDASPGDGGVVLAGAGIGAYVALLLAGARPSVVRAALLGPGAGLGETDGEPDFARPPERLPPSREVEAGADPALARFLGEMRPRTYVASFAERATRLVLLEDDGHRPLWWRIARGVPRAETVRGDWKRGLEALGRTE